MARTLAELPKGSRITDYISVGLLSRAFPAATVRTVLERTGRSSVRHRELPAHVVIYYVMALALYMQSSYREVLRCLLEAVDWLQGTPVLSKVTGKSGISQARRRVGWVPLKELYDQIVRPIATERTKGAWYRQWRLVSMDGSTLDVADISENVRAFGRPAASRGKSAYLQVRFVSLLENGTHVLFGAAVGGCRVGEVELSKDVISSLRPGMLCMADRYFLGYHLWSKARRSGADLLWRGRRNLRLEQEQRLPDGSYLSRIYSSTSDQRRKTDGIQVRVIDYKLEGVPDSEPFYRLLTTILDWKKAPAEELAALYHERWEIETALDELKTHLRGAKIVLRSKTKDLVLQEFYGLLMAHFAIRSLMHDAALDAEVDPDKISFIHAVRVLRRKLPRSMTIPPSG